MKLSKYYSSNIFQKLNLFALLLFVFWLPLKDNYLPLIIALWIFTWLLEGNIKEKFDSFSYKKLLPGFGLYFFLTILALVHSNDINYGLFHVQEKLSLVFFPIILAGSNNKIKNNYKSILLIFVLGNLIASIYVFANAFFSNLIIENGDWYVKYWQWDIHKNISFWQLVNMRYNSFSGLYLSSFMHPSYFSMFILFSIVILIYLLRKKYILKPSHKIFTGIIISFFMFMIYLLQSRAGFLAFVTSSFFVILFEILKKRKKRFIFIGLIIITLGTVFLLSSKKMQVVSNQLIELIKSPQNAGLQKKDARFQTNYAAFQVIKENFWFGTAPANLTAELEKKYKQYGFKSAEKEHLNTHNQYLETFAGLGIFGFLSLMYILIYGFVYAYKNKHYLLFFLMTILSINFLFEAMLNRMAGVLFMMFFFSLFVFMNGKQFQEKHDTSKINNKHTRT